MRASGAPRRVCPVNRNKPEQHKKRSVMSLHWMLRRLRGTSVAVLLGGLLGLSQPAAVDAAGPPIAGAISGGGPSLSALRYDLTIPSFDGTPIAVTIFQPALSKGQHAPLLMYSHG